LQFHHDECWALGGSDQVSNLRLLCASHNRLLAEQEFGESYVAERQAARRNDKTLSASASAPSIRDSGSASKSRRQR
jgi:hypothetical protein